MAKADNSAALRLATQRRSEEARRRVLGAISSLSSENRPVTPTTVAMRAGVSRQWLYTFDEALEAIRAIDPPKPAGVVPQDQRASLASLKRRIETLTDDNRRLRERVEELEGRLAGVYGVMRSARP